MGAMVDSCVLLDIFTEDTRWLDWSTGALADAANRGDIILNPVIYAEVSVSFERIEELEAVLPGEVFTCRAIPREAAFLAGKCFLKYRRRGGLRTAPLPDFFIGAHALVAGLALITRDAKRFKDYFPTLNLIAPKTAG
jgi:predicted nucleic acid-binding protein